MKTPRVTFEVATAATVLALIGCAPVNHEFFRFHHEEATYIQRGCFGTEGPPRIAFFPFEGIYISVTIYEMTDERYGQSEVTVGIHVPEGQNARLVNKDIEVEYESPEGKAISRISLQPVNHYRRGANLPYVFQYPDPFGREDYFGLLSGGTQEITFKLAGAPRTAYKWYEFSALFNPANVTSGSVRLPAISVNGVEHPGPKLSFNRDHYFEIQGYCP